MIRSEVELRHISRMINVQIDRVIHIYCTKKLKKKFIINDAKADLRFLQNVDVVTHLYSMRQYSETWMLNVLFRHAGSKWFNSFSMRTEWWFIVRMVTPTNWMKFKWRTFWWDRHVTLEFVIFLTTFLSIIKILRQLYSVILS